jgi:predicted nucleic acid-binding protein
VTEHVTERFVLDAQAVLASPDDEPGAEDVAAVLASRRTGIFISAVNVGEVDHEVDHVVRRRLGAGAARKTEDALYEHPRILVVEATRERIRAAAAIRAEGGVSFADAFAAGLAIELNAQLLTGDPEFRQLEPKGRGLPWLGDGWRPSPRHAAREGRLHSR